MNCKPGDLAVCVGGDRPETIGALVQVLRPYAGRTLWRAPADWVVLFRGKEAAAADRWLRPIRPGDVTDSEVRELYAPKQPETV